MSKQASLQERAPSVGRLEAYRLTTELLQRVHDFARTLPEIERSMSNGLLRASESIPTLMAEAYAGPPIDSATSLTGAMAAGREIAAHLRIALKLEYLSGDEYERLLDDIYLLNRELYRLRAAER